MPEILEAYRTGAGIDWADYGPDVIEAQEAVNRPHFRHHVGAWIDDLPDIAARLRAAGGRVADVACGTGWSSISIAQHFPGVSVDGIDIDPGSIERARANAAEEGDGATASASCSPTRPPPTATGQYDLVTIFEALHDMSRPVEVLRAARACSRRAARSSSRTSGSRSGSPPRATRPSGCSTGSASSGCLVNGRFDQPSVGDRDGHAAVGRRGAGP